MNSCLKVWFYNPAHESESYFNKLVAYCDGPFCHCEVQFPDNMAFTVYMGTSVMRKQRTFDTSKYTSVSIQCSHVQLSQARACAEQEFNDNKAFSMIMMGLALTKVPFSSPNGTFCSKLCADILIAGNLLPTQSTQHISPSALHRILSEKYVQGAKTPVIDFKLDNFLLLPSSTQGLEEASRKQK